MKENQKLKRMFDKYQIQTQKMCTKFCNHDYMGHLLEKRFKNHVPESVYHSEQVSVMSRSRLYTVQAIPYKTACFYAWSLCWLHYTYLDHFIKIQIPIPHLRHTELDCLGGREGLGTCLFQISQVTLRKSDVRKSCSKCTTYSKKRSRMLQQCCDGKILHFLFLINLCHYL